MRLYTEKRRLTNKLYWSKPENHMRRLQRNRLEYKTNPRKFATERQKSEIRNILRVLTGVNPPRRTPIDILYDWMVQEVLHTPKLAQDKFPHGIPDAKNLKTELKIGFDKIHGGQFIWNILNGHDCKIRWIPSYDSLEEALLGKVNNSKLFESYKQFVVWKYGAIDEDYR